jgi:hypothetical protein
MGPWIFASVVFVTTVFLLVNYPNFRKWFFVSLVIVMIASGAVLTYVTWPLMPISEMPVAASAEKFDPTEYGAVLIDEKGSESQSEEKNKNELPPLPEGSVLDSDTPLNKP